MKDEDRKAFGVTDEEERSTMEWLRLRMGMVLGAVGRGGSGTFIELEDGRVALLTARHVVVGCILTGRMTVARLSEPRVYSVEPKAIRIDNRKDAAILVFDSDTLRGEAVPYAEWSRNRPVIAAGMRAIISGIVGEWKEPDLATNTIPLTKWLSYWTGVTNPLGPKGFVVCDVDETNSELPKSFGGMSGGPFISVDRRLLGVNTAELRRKAGTETGEFFVTRLADLNNLFHPYVQPADVPAGHMRVEARLSFMAVNIKSKAPRVPATVDVEYFWSTSDPDGVDGRVGRITSIRFGAPTGAERYIINGESVFRWDGGDTDEDRLHALKEELFFFLQETGFELAK